MNIPLTRHITHLPALFAIASAALFASPWATPSAQAATFDLGTINAPIDRHVGNTGLLGPFADSFTFTIGAGHELSWSAFVSTGFNRRSQILDMDGELWGSSGLLEAGDATTIYAPEGWPSRDVSFGSIVLGPGDYVLKMTGTAKSVFPEAPIWSLYNGTVSFAAVAAPVPEPTVGMLMLAGLGALWLARRRVAIRSM
jgi:hypothetical protein